MKQVFLFVLIFVAPGVSYAQSNASSSNDKCHLEYRIGVTGNFIDQRTKKYFYNYPNIHFGATLYIRNFFVSYSFNPTTLKGVKSELKNSANDSIMPYHFPSWYSNSNYFANIIKSNIDLGYEFKVGKNMSFAPTLGMAAWRFVIHNATHTKKIRPAIFDVTLGLRCRRYFTFKGATFFYGVQGYLGYSTVQNTFSSLGNSYWTATINLGFKFVPKGQGAKAIINALLDYPTHHYIKR